MGITLARIDNRLLHGIVATQWAGRSGAQRIMIIDDGVANNELTKASMKLAPYGHGHLHHYAGEGAEQF
jgi:mannose/fructose/N-acetylgalactosamine-specific phosphotransferase system component IIB